MRRTLRLILAATAFAAFAASAAAATQATFIGPNSDSATQSCAGGIGPASGAGIVHSEATCTSPAVGTAIGTATATPGHLQTMAGASSHNGDSLVAKIGSLARSSDQVVFTSTDPTATTAIVAADLQLDGILAGAINGGGQFRVLFSFLGADFDLRQGVDQNGPFGTFNSGWVLESGQLGPATDLRMRTGFITAPLNTPITFLMLMEVTAAASGGGASGLADFGINSFHFAATPFLVGPGVTAAAGDYIVDNRFVDPLAPGPGGVPEPAEWTLLVAGLGVVGAVLRSRPRVAGRATPSCA